MARGRVIDRRIHSHVKLGKLALGVRYLFQGLIIHSDDEGRMKADPLFLKAAIFPYDLDLTAEMVRSWRDQLAAGGFITLYAKEGDEYLQSPTWTKWQPLRNDRIRPSDLPSPKDAGCHLVATCQPLVVNPRPLPNLTQPNQTQPKEPQPKSEKRKSDPRIREVIDWFHRRLEQQLGEKPATFNGGAAAAGFSRLLKTYSVGAIAERFDPWFSSTDPFIVKRGHRVEDFLSNFNVLKSGPIQGGSNAGSTRRQDGYIGHASPVGKYAFLSKPKVTEPAGSGRPGGSGKSVERGSGAGHSGPDVLPGPVGDVPKPQA